MKIIAVYLSVFALLIGIGLLAMPETASATEKPDYTVIETDGKFEIREYPPMILAEVTVEGDRRQAGNRGFRKLAAFIFGDSVSKDKVAMTAPVVSKPETIAMTSPVVSRPETSGGTTGVASSVKEVLQDENGRWIVNFMMPSEYTLESLPKPTDPDIRIFKTEPYRTVSIRYNGNNTTKNIVEHEAKLKAYIEEKDLTVGPTPEYAGYNAPFVPGLLKRNEVHFRLEN